MVDRAKMRAALGETAVFSYIYNCKLSFAYSDYGCLSVFNYNIIKKIKRYIGFPCKRNFMSNCQGAGGIFFFFFQKCKTKYILRDQYIFLIVTFFFPIVSSAWNVNIVCHNNFA